jgi:hypothetical protein
MCPAIHWGGALRCRPLEAPLRRLLRYGELVANWASIPLFATSSAPRTPLRGSSRSVRMTDQQSLDDIAMLLMQYPGVSSARGFTSGSDGSDGKVWIHFRCSEWRSLKAIASCAVAANVVITVGDPDGALCYEAEDVADLPFDVEIEDAQTPPTYCEVFGVFLARNLEESGLLGSDVADELLRRWNAATRG